METFVKAGAIVQLSPMSDSAAIIDLADVISQLLADPARRQELGQRAKRLVAQNRGATTQTVEWLRPILSISPKLTDRVSSLRAKSACTE
jgi:3-deoxy-D-manno-octulosonic-acid transferase